MYLDYWHLKEKPFEITPDVRFFYASKNHEEALQRLLFSCEEHRGAMVLTGDCGCGKTLLSRVLISDLAKNVRCQLALIVNPKVSAKEFLALICFELGGLKEKNMRDKVFLMDQLKQLLESNAKAKRKTTLIIDEAQAIESEEVLEEVRLLMNFQTESEILLNIIFIGQPEFKEKILSLKQLSQRIQMWFHLTCLDVTDINQYIQHRLKVAGVDSDIFHASAHQKIYDLTGGVPRFINNICNMALWIGEKECVQKIDAELVETAFRTLKG